MIARLGEVIFWACCAIALGAACIIVYGYLYFGFKDPVGAALLAGVGVIFFLFGRACLYVLAGK